MLSLIIDIVAFIIAAIPLYFAVEFLGGKTTFLNVLLVNLIAGVLFAIFGNRFLFGTLLAFFLLIWIYHEVFRLKWYKAVLAWMLQFVFIALFYLLLFLIGLMFGSSFFVTMMPWHMF